MDWLNNKKPYYAMDHFELHEEVFKRTGAYMPMNIDPLDPIRSIQMFRTNCLDALANNPRRFNLTIDNDDDLTKFRFLK